MASDQSYTLDIQAQADDPTLMLVRDYELEEILRHRLDKIELSADAPAQQTQISDDVSSLLDEAIAALTPFACDCSGRCESAEWLPADNSKCVRRLARVTLAKLRAARDENR